MNKQHFTIERMLSLASFKWRMFGSLSDSLFICNQCLPIVVPHGVDFTAQTGDDMLFGHVFLDNIGLHKNGMPRLHHEKCANCGKFGQCWKLEIRVGAFGYVHEHEFRANHIEFPGECEVAVMGKRGRIVQSMGHDKQRPWITIYTIKFDDGTRFDAYRWQFQIVSKS